jgi:hypothetical protein
MIQRMESVRHDEADSDEARAGAAERLGGWPSMPASVGELTVQELDEQRRLVRESLLRSA